MSGLFYVLGVAGLVLTALGALTAPTLLLSAVGLSSTISLAVACLLLIAVGRVIALLSTIAAAYRPPTPPADPAAWTKPESRVDAVLRRASREPS